MRIVDIHFLQECINFHFIIGYKVCHFITVYRSPNQSLGQLNSLIRNLQLNLEKVANCNPFLVVVVGVLNANSLNWCSSDKTNFEEVKIDAPTSQIGLHEIIKNPTRILDNSSSCTDLIFTSQLNLVMELGVHVSLHANCHHQIIHAKFNLKIYCPPPYKRVIWHYQDANADDIRKAAICSFNWKRVFTNKDVNQP